MSKLDYFCSASSRFSYTHAEHMVIISLRMLKGIFLCKNIMINNCYMFSYKGMTCPLWNVNKYFWMGARLPFNQYRQVQLQNCQVLSHLKEKPCQNGAFCIPVTVSSKFEWNCGQKSHKRSTVLFHWDKRLMLRNVCQPRLASSVSNAGATWPSRGSWELKLLIHHP